MKAVFDTNVLVAAFITEGVCAKLLGRARRKQLDLVISLFILKEFENVLSKKFSASKEDMRAAAKLISEVVQMVNPAPEVSGVCRDPDDDKYLACAVDGEADVIVSGDKDLVTLREFASIPIVSPRRFVELHG